MRSLIQQCRENTEFRHGLFYVHIDRGLELIDRISQWPGVKRLADIGIAVFVGLMVASFVLLSVIAKRVLEYRPEPTAAQDPVNMLAIPGVNDFLPFAAAGYIAVALFVAAAVHELAHGVALRSDGIPVEELGIVLVGVIPIAAYVSPDEDAFENATVRSKARVFTAGVFVNILVFAVATALFTLPVTQSPFNLFFTFFGTAVGAEIPPELVVEQVGPISNLLFWTWVFNINLAFVNVLPIAYLDGGQLVTLVTDIVDTRVEKPVANAGLLAFTTLGTVGVFVLAVFGPLFLS